MSRLSGKVAMVTGCSGERGIGRAIVRRLAVDGADVVLTSSGVRLGINKPTGGWGGLEAVAKEVRDAGQRALTVSLDVRSAVQIDEAMDCTLKEFGRLDILVNNAAAPAGADRVPVTQLSEDAWDIVLDVNLKGSVPLRESGSQCDAMPTDQGPNHQHRIGQQQGGTAEIGGLLRIKVWPGGVHASLGDGTRACRDHREHYLPRAGGHRTCGPLRAARGWGVRRSAPGCAHRRVVSSHPARPPRDPEGRGRPYCIPCVGGSRVHHRPGHQSCRWSHHALNHYMLRSAVAYVNFP